MAKRSPILGYNHNVRYRGLVFHVQTEDSGLLSPHLFTHLFYGGVIISTRKLVYDAGAAEDAIKSLMQAQHKAVLKDLRKGSFDDKIDQYLAGTPGLLPRGAGVDEAEPELGRGSAVALPTAAPSTVEPATSRAPTVADSRSYDEPPAPAQARARTAERKSPPSAVRTNLPPAPTEDAPTLSDDAAAGVAAAIAAANATVPTALPAGFVDTPSTLEPEIEIQLELDEDDHSEPIPLVRPIRDTEVSEAVRPEDLVAAAPPPSPNAHPRAPSAVGAATLPPARPIARPPSRPAITPPQVVSRAVHDRSDAVEVYAPPPPSADTPPGLAERDRPGQYAQHKKASGKMPVIESARPPTGANPIAGRPQTGANPVVGAPRAASASASSSGVPKPIGREPSSSMRSVAAREPSSGSIAKPRTMTPSRVSPSRAGTPNGTGSGVVMTRPAVIVGAPAKPPGTPPRVRKAREDEGRGFGQGLISEKSLDEVILAYLSEDADEK